MSHPQHWLRKAAHAISQDIDTDIITVYFKTFVLAYFYIEVIYL